MAIPSIGRASATQYKFILNHIPISGSNIHDLDTFRLNIFSVVLPGMSLDSSQMDWQGKHINVHHGGITFDPLNINFIVDIGSPPSTIIKI
jgi:hypothetical protein